MKKTFLFIVSGLLLFVIGIEIVKIANAAKTLTIGGDNNQVLLKFSEIRDNVNPLLQLTNTDVPSILTTFNVDKTTGALTINNDNKDTLTLKQGNVGIGTLAPNKKLHVYSASPNAEIDIQTVAGTGNHWGIYNSDENSLNALRFWQGSDRMTITKDGNVGIGTTAPGSKLTISGGDIDLGNGRIKNVSMPTNDSDVSTKRYVDQLEDQYSKKYTVVLALRSGYSCPEGYTEESLANSDNWYIRINSSGLAIDNVGNVGYGEEYNYAYFNKANGPAKICWKSFKSAFRPHMSVFTFDTDSLSNCPTGYTYLSNNALEGNNTWAYLQSTDAGTYIGYVDSWARGSQPYQNGYSSREWYPSINKSLCFKVMGVSEDADTKTGVFPVFLGVKSDFDCNASLGQGWTQKSVSNYGNNKWSYLLLNDNTSVFGPLYNWGHGGENTNAVSLHDTYVNSLCYKYFSTTGKPFVSLKTIKNNCPFGYYQINKDKLLGWNNNAYYQYTPYGLYIGGLYSWTRNSNLDGWMTNNWTNSTDITNFCFKIEGYIGTSQSDLVYGSHSSQQCTDAGGTVFNDGADKACRFTNNSCANITNGGGNWKQYKSWSKTQITYNTGFTCSSSPCDSDYNHFCRWEGCNQTGSHNEFLNIAPEFCLHNWRCSDHKSCGGDECVVNGYYITATATEVGCY